jgi:hypothetical protein
LKVAKESINLLDFSKNIYSQNGEDGVIKKLFSIIGTTNKFCCEFGAWDGRHFSNTHLLINRQGWSGVQIEADTKKYKQLQKTYKNNSKVNCVNVLIDTDKNSLEAIFKHHVLPQEFDFLSVDIDGSDYYILKALKLRPRVICIEVNAGHSPSSTKIVPKNIASQNVGQSLANFCKAASRIGYRLICYNGNAFFLRHDVGFEDILPTLSPKNAYLAFIRNLSRQQKAYLYSVNRGWVPPYHRYNNNLLTASRLRMSPHELSKEYITYKKLQSYRKQIGEIV